MNVWLWFESVVIFKNRILIYKQLTHFQILTPMHIAHHKQN
jgi:hypothetical protein